MDEDQYLQGEPYNQEDNDLPSTFLSDEDIATGGTNIIFIPDLKINLSLVLDNYVEYISKAKSKDELKSILYQIWDQATNHGGLKDRLERLQLEVDALEMDISGIAYEIEYLDDDSE